MLIRLEIDMDDGDEGIAVYEQLENIVRTWIDKCLYLSLKVDNK